jgi:hypothetical protein
MMDVKRNKRHVDDAKRNKFKVWKMAFSVWIFLVVGFTIPLCKRLFVFNDGRVMSYA